MEMTEILATTQLTDARKRSIIFVTRQAICTQRKKKAPFFALEPASSKNKLSKLNEIKKIHRNG